MQAARVVKRLSVNHSRPSAVRFSGAYRAVEHFAERYLTKGRSQTLGRICRNPSPLSDHGPAECRQLIEERFFDERVFRHGVLFQISSPSTFLRRSVASAFNLASKSTCHCLRCTLNASLRFCDSYWPFVRSFKCRWPSICNCSINYLE